LFALPTEAPFALRRFNQKETTMKRLLPFSLLLICVAGLALAAQNETAALTSAPVARELQRDEKHTYQLTLTAKQAAHIVATQQGADVQLLVYDPAGKVLADMDSPNGTRGDESVWIINQPAGVYRVEVKLFQSQNERPIPGKYEIKLAELRAATAADAKRWQAQAAFVESKHLRKTDPKAANAKLAEAARLLGHDGDRSLSAAVDGAIFQNAPMLKVQQLNLAKVPGMVTTYHSADLAEVAMNKRALLESLLSFYQTLLNAKFEMSFAMLNQDDWKRLCPACPYMAPITTPAPITLLQSNSTQSVKGMLSMFKSKAPASLNSALAAEGLSYDTAAPLVLEAASYLSIAGAINNQSAAEHIPKVESKRWMSSVVTAYLVHAWLGEKHPQLRKQIKLGLQLPGAVLTPANRTLEGIFNANDPLTAGVALSRAADLGSDLYDRHKLGFLTDVLKAFPKGASMDAAAAEARFIALSPVIKPWLDSFANAPAANAASISADNAVRITLELARQAIERFDKGFYEEYLADGYVETDMDGKTYTRKEVLDNWITPPTPSKVSVTFEDLNIRVNGDFALASYRFNWRSETRDQTFNVNMRNSDVLQRQNGRWRLLSQHYSRIPKPPAIVKVDAKILDEYAGRYRSDDGVIGVITHESDKLMEQMDGTPLKVELQPESETVFRLKDQSWQRVFVRDGQGKVTHLLVRAPDGQEFKATKVK
jgi:ketosteroid isomerase-like protein